MSQNSKTGLCMYCGCNRNIPRISTTASRKSKSNLKLENLLRKASEQTNHVCINWNQNG